jgi:ribulose-phosphate 3-epimerase
MIEEPDRYLEGFVTAGADAISVHVEAAVHLQRTLSAVRELGAASGVALNPATDLCLLGEALNYADYVLLMTVNPGFAGQRFIPQTLDKVRRLRRLLPEGIALEVDGGVGRETLPSLLSAGANWFVAGSAIFGAPDPGTEIATLAGLLQEA